MEDKYSRFMLVRHKRDGYIGWIDGTTRIKELFTGNKECEWQYRIAIKANEFRKIAPEEDLYPIKEHEASPSLLRSIADEKKKYHNNCWSCGWEVRDDRNIRCNKCRWYICSNCGNCGCGYKIKD